MTEKPEIVETTQILSCLPEKRSGNRFQGGNCPVGHESVKRRCWTIYPDTQSCYCQHCHIGGDSYELIKAKLKCSFTDAVSWAKEHGLITENGQTQTSYLELRKVHQILTDAAKFFHDNLKDSTHLTNHYDFTEETIRQYQIGYAPLDKHALKKHLLTRSHDLADIKKSGLLGNFDDSFFQGQFVFPYWHQGLVKYFIGRQTPETPSWKEGKYEKLPVNDLIKNDYFFGEDSIRKAQEVFVQEGISDCISSLQYGLPSISPVTTQFKKSDQDKLLSLVRGKRVFIVPDAEASEAGLKGAQETQAFLKSNGVEATIITLPRPADKTKVDFNEFVRDHGIEAFNRLVEEQTPRRVIPASILLRKEYPKEQEIIGKGILPKGGGLIIAGESGDGKSLLRGEIAIRLNMGWDICGLEVPTARRVFIFSFENPEATEAYRLKKMLEGLQITNFPDHLSFSNPTIRLDLNLKRDRAEALEIVKESEAEVIIYDPLTSLHSVPENDNVQIRKILDTITEINRKTGTSAIVIHHFGKPQEGLATAHRTRGASSIRDWADTLIAVTRKKHEHQTLRLLEFIKVRNGPEVKPILLERDEYFLHHVTEDDMLCPPEKVKAILTALGGKVEEQEALKKAIMETTGCNEKSARTYISLAVDRKAIKCDSNPQDGRRKLYYVEN